MLPILYEDNHLLVVNKPAGLLTQPSGTSQDSAEAICKAWIKEKYQKPGNVFLEAAHRLDKPVSGLVLFAKTSKALSRLHAILREKKAVKVYLALVEKAPKHSEATLEHVLRHGEHRARILPALVPGAQLARLHYKLVGKREGGYLLEVTLETGRYHQIRAQLAAENLPIIGDEKYGGKKMQPGEIALHHFHLEIPHPVKPISLVLEAPPPSWALLE